MKKYIVLFCAISALCAFNACKNPFAPALNDSVGLANTPLGDQHTIDGVFQKFAYAYAYKDTTIYGEMLADNFTFVFRDYDLNADVSWGRDVEMHSTSGLFQNAQNLNLVWNNILLQSGDSLQTTVARSFNLTITFNPEDIVFITGNAQLTLNRPNVDSVWQLTYWRDNSNY
jgi:hypothetical protein